jgi:CRP-like cAMP-binding protein
MTSSIEPTGEANWLLRALPEEERTVVQLLLETVQLERKAVLFSPGQRITHAYFPQSGCCSCVTTLGDGRIVETSAVGWEGMVGLPLVNGVDRVGWQCFVQIPGPAKRIAAAPFIEAIRLYPALSRTLLRYSQVSFDHAGQTVACNARHSVLERCAKWLLLAHDKMDRGPIPLTHDLLAIMLGIRRASVTEALDQLRGSDVVAFTRGSIAVRDRKALELLTCECYQAMWRAYWNALPDARPPAGSRTPEITKGLVAEGFSAGNLSLLLAR